MGILAWFRPLGRTLEPETDASRESALCYEQVERAHGLLDRLFVRKVTNLGLTAGRALDIGCGPGLLAIRLSRALPALRMIALDLSMPMLERARANAKDARAHGLDFVQADAASLPFADCTFDMVLSHHTLHHLPSPHALLEEMLRVTKPGGYVLLRDLIRPALRGLLQAYVLLYGCIYNRLGPLSAKKARELYRASLEAAMSHSEWAAMAKACGVPRQRVSSIPLLSHAEIVVQKERKVGTPLGA